MSYLTINELEVHKAHIVMPRMGVWHGTFLVATDQFQQVLGRVTISIGNSNATPGPVQLVGTSSFGNQVIGMVALRVVGGNGGIAKSIPPKFFRRTTLDLPLQDILTEAGERLSSNPDPASMASFLDAWSRHRCTAGQALTTLAAQLEGGVWRVEPDGGIFLGRERWEATKLGDYQLLGEDPVLGQIIISAERPNIFPGEVINDKLISIVEHTIENDRLRTTLFIERPQS